MFVISFLRGRKFNKKMALLKRNRLKNMEGSVIYFHSYFEGNFVGWLLVLGNSCRM